MDKEMEATQTQGGKKRCFCGKNKKTIAALLFLGGCAAILAVFLPHLFKKMVKEQLVISKDSFAYNIWHRPPADAILMTYHVFNYTNVDEMIDNPGKVKPNVTQIGPFVYRELRVNEVLDYNDYEITYVQNYTYIFEPSLSCATCNLSDKVYVPNIVAIGLYNQLYGNKEHFSWWMKPLLQVGGPKMFAEHKISEVIWGYTDTDIALIKGLGKWFSEILKRIGIELPSSPIVALQHNGTAQAEAIGNLTILTGKKDINDVQKIVRWRGLDHAPYWLTKYGMMLNGTDGSHAQPFLRRDQLTYSFVPELCRSLYQVYQKDVSFRGIDLYRYHTTPYLFANHTVNPDNIAFCLNNETCYGSGVLPISKCQDGHPPVFMSSPHFFMADPKYVNAINGIHPNETLHQTVVDIEPITGITIRAHKRLQVNIMSIKCWITKTQIFPDSSTMLPILMAEESDAVGPSTAAMFHSKVLNPKQYVVYGQYGVIGLSGSILFAAFVIVALMVADFYKATNAYKQDPSKSKSGGKEKRQRMEDKENPCVLNRETSRTDIIANEYTA